MTTAIMNDKILYILTTDRAMTFSNKIRSTSHKDRRSTNLYESGIVFTIYDNITVDVNFCVI